MGTPQETVADAPNYGLPGQIAGPDADVDTVLNEETSAPIPFGRVVQLGTLENRAKIPSAKTDKLIGISCFAHGYQRDTELTSLGIVAGTHFGIVTRGYVWVMPEEDMVPGDDVHARVTANSAKAPGMIGTTDDGAKTIDISAFAQVKTAGGPTSGQPMKLWVDFNNAALAVTDS